MKISNEFDDKGRLAKSTAKQGDSKQIATFEYYANGVVKSQSTRIGLLKVEYEFDEFGHQTMFENTSTSDDEPQTTTIKTKCNYDSSGKPAAATRTTTDADGKTTTVELEVETDDAGNITRVTSDDGSYSVYKYAKIDNPSPNARMQASRTII